MLLMRNVLPLRNNAGHVCFRLGIATVLRNISAWRFFFRAGLDCCVSLRQKLLKSIGFFGLSARIFGLAGPALADRIKNPTAVFAGLDKITGRIITFEVAIDETVQFGTLQVTPKICYTRPPTEAPQTDAFVEVVELTSTKEFNKLFSGWMFAASPGLHGVEHAVYDVWLTDCKGGKDVIVTPTDAALQPQDPQLPVPNVNPVPAPAQKKKKTDLPVASDPSGLAAPSTPAPAPAAPNNGPIKVGPAPGARLPANTVITLPASPAATPNARTDEGGLLPPADIPNGTRAKPRKIIPVDPFADPNVTPQVPAR